ncbi:Hypothetical predicted protein, partial [Mytilus galloprovincialis]
MAHPVISIAFFLTSAICMVESSHFRGGLITWKPAENNQIEITYRVAFRRSFSNSHFCDENSIGNGNLLPGEGSLQCQLGCSDVITRMSYVCTDFSASEDWTTGVRSVKYTFPASNNNIFHFGFTGCCWIGLVEGGGNWIMRTTANLTTRNDIGRINSSPVSAMQPIVRFNYGCDYTLNIIVADDDGDTVRCRWAKSTPYDECSGVCNTLSGSYLDEAKCFLKYNATRSVGWFAVALQLEDFRSPMDTIPLSSVSLQFLVYVFHSTESCTSRPVFPPNIITDGSVHHILANDIFNVSIYARSGAETLRVTAINTVSPIGMTKSELYPHGTSGREWFVVVTWIPTLGQTGSHVFCFTAVDNIGQTSDQICGTLVVHGETLPPTVTTKTTTTTATKATITANTAATTATVTATTTTTITEKPPPQTTTPLTTNMPDNSTSSTDSVVDVIPPSEVNNVLVAGVAVGGLAIFGVSAFAIARFLGLGKSAQIWASSLKPDKSMINTNVNADNFNTLDYKGEYVSTTPAKSHAFSKIEITYRFAFTRGSNVAFFCDENAIKNRTLLAGIENIQCQSGCAGIITKNYIYCTDFSETEDWTIGVMNFKYTLPVSNTKKFHFGLTGCCWLPLNEAGYEAGYILRARVDLTNRSDTGRINSSPISAMQPVFRLNQGCDYTIKIPVADDDGDTVRCRWAKNTPYDECSDVCNTFTGSYLDE